QGEALRRPPAHDAPLLSWTDARCNRGLRKRAALAAELRAVVAEHVGSREDRLPALAVVGPELDEERQREVREARHREVRSLALDDRGWVAREPRLERHAVDALRRPLLVAIGEADRPERLPARPPAAHAAGGRLRAEQQVRSPVVDAERVAV